MKKPSGPPDKKPKQLRRRHLGWHETSQEKYTKHRNSEAAFLRNKKKTNQTNKENEKPRILYPAR